MPEFDLPERMRFHPFRGQLGRVARFPTGNRCCPPDGWSSMRGPSAGVGKCGAHRCRQVRLPCRSGYRFRAAYDGRFLIGSWFCSAGRIPGTSGDSPRRGVQRSGAGGFAEHPLTSWTAGRAAESPCWKPASLVPLPARFCLPQSGDKSWRVSRLADPPNPPHGGGSGGSKLSAAEGVVRRSPRNPRHSIPHGAETVRAIFSESDGSWRENGEKTFTAMEWNDMDRRPLAVTPALTAVTQTFLSVLSQAPATHPNAGQAFRDNIPVCSFTCPATPKEQAGMPVSRRPFSRSGFLELIAPIHHAYRRRHMRLFK